MFGTRAKSYALYSAGHSLNVPTAIPVPRRVASVCLGADHTLLVDVNGCLWAAGDNSAGQLGLGLRRSSGLQDIRDRDSFVSVPTFDGRLHRAVGCAAGMEHSLVMTSDGDVFSFGRNGQFQLGRDTPTFCAEPRLVENWDGRAAQVSAGFNLSAIVTEDGELLTWGQGNEGGLGHAAYVTRDHHPLTDHTTYQGCYTAKLVRRTTPHPTDYKPLSFSDFDEGVIDLFMINSIIMNSPIPLAVGVPGRVVSVAVGGGHMVALTQSGAKSCVGGKGPVCDRFGGQRKPLVAF